jgi:carbon-monoxide dehydrogenase medium subunit
MIPFDLVEPKSLDEALGLLDPDDPSVRPASGFTALMLMMKSAVFAPSRLVSLQKVERKYAEISETPDGNLQMGALATLSEMEKSPLVRRHAPVIEKAMRRLANVRVRNVARLGGNLAHGDPHMDLPPVLASLGARLCIKARNRTRIVDLDDFFVGYFETAMQRDELIAFVELPDQRGWSSAYEKCTTRSADDWPALGIACSIRWDGDHIQDVRLIASAATEKLTRLSSAEAELRGQSLSSAVSGRAAEAGMAETRDILVEDSRGSASYKAELMRVYIGRCLQQARDEGGRP